jgi:hypothetical protein
MTAFIAIALIVFLGVALIVALSGIAIYARVVKLRTAVTSSWSEIDIDLKKRHALVPEPKFRELENNITVAVRTYNAAVQDYNIAIETFPANLVAKWYNLKKAEFFDMKLS